MTIANTTALAGPFYPNGVTVVFPFSFKAFSKNEVRVFLVDSNGVENDVSPASYTFTANPLGGGSINITPALTAAAGTLFIESAPAFTQNIQFENQSAFRAPVHTEGLDRAAARDIWLRGRALRSILFPAGEQPAPIPGAALRKSGKVLGFNPLTGALEVQGAGAFKGDPGGNAMAIGTFSIASTLTIPGGTDLVQTSGYSVAGRGQARYAYDAAVDAAYVTANPRSSFRTVNGRGFRLVEPNADAMMFGAVGDGVADDAPAVQAMVNATQYGFLPPGRYRFGSTVTLDDAQVLYGAGTSAWEPYTGAGPFPNIFRTEIVVDGILALDGTGKNSFSVSGLAIKSKTGVMSGFGTAPGFQAGARGIDITHTMQAQIDNVSFHGLEVAVDANQDTGLPAGSMLRAQSAQMPSITRWMAADCGTVFRFGNLATTDRLNPGVPGYVDPNPYTVRDARIGECVIALHCGKMIDAHYCDGLRVENCRFFQAYSNSIYIRKTPFVTLSAVTCFENRIEQVVIKDSQYVTISGCDFTRAGCYANANPGYPAYTALTIDGCEHVVFEGRITQPGGRPISVVNSKNVYLAGSIYQAFWTNGNPTGDTGSIDIRTSSGVEINLVETLGANYIGVWCDEESAPTVSGTYATDGTQGCVRAYIGPKSMTFVFRQETSLDVGPGGTSAVFATPRVRIPAGKSIYVRSVQMTSPGIIARSGSTFWNSGLVNDADTGSVEYATKGLATNGGSTPGFFQLPLTFYNPTGGTITIPAGHETRISFAVA